MGLLSRVYACSAKSALTSSKEVLLRTLFFTIPERPLGHKIVVTMANELEKIIGEKTVETPAPNKQESISPEEKKANLDRAIAEAQDELRKTREATRKAKQGVLEEEDLPKIDDTDPNAKAWNKRIQDNTAPINSQMERQKDEVRTFALRRFLQDKPSLSKSPEKLKELMTNYDRLKVATEQTQEGILIDLEKAYGATFHEELVSAARNSRIEQAKEDMIASDIAISHGATSETTTPPAKRQYTAEERQILATWEQHGAPKVD